MQVQQKIIVGFAGLFVAMTLGLLAYLNFVRRMEDNFDSLPWRRWPLDEAGEEREAWSRLDESHKPSLCPFTGLSYLSCYLIRPVHASELAGHCELSLDPGFLQIAGCR